MLILFFTLSLFCSALLIHMVVWRIATPKGHLMALFKIFFLVLVFGLILLWVAPAFKVGIVIEPINFPAYLHIIFFYGALTLAYLGSYPAIEANSPSVLVIMHIANAEPNGLSIESLNQVMSDDVLIKPKIIDLIRAKMIRLEADRYFITLRGIMFVKIFIWYRKIIGAPKGG